MPLLRIPSHEQRIQISARNLEPGPCSSIDLNSQLSKAIAIRFRRMTGERSFKFEFDSSISQQAKIFSQSIRNGGCDYDRIRQIHVFSPQLYRFLIDLKGLLFILEFPVVSQETNVVRIPNINTAAATILTRVFFFLFIFVFAFFLLS